MTQIQKASSGADTRQCRRETSWSCLVLDGVDYQRMLEGQKAEPARTPIIRVIIYLWQQWSLSKRGDTGRVKGEKDRSIVTSGDLKAHFTEIHQEIHTAGLRKPEETSNTHVWADPSGTWPLAVGTAPSSQACICSAREHIYPAPLLPPPPHCAPFVYSIHENTILMLPLGLLTGVSFVAEHVQAWPPGELVHSFDRCTSWWETPAVFLFVCFLSQKWSWLKFVCSVISSVAFLIALAVTHSYSLTRMRSWEQTLSQAYHCPHA